MANESRSAWSLAHLLLLSKFLRPRRVEPSTNDHSAGRWNAALKETEQEAIDRFFAADLLYRPPLPERLAFSFSGAQLKQMLHERNLKLSGRKDELALRLWQADPAGMENSLAGIVVLQCSLEGKVLADQFVERKKAMEQAGLEALRKGNVEEAIGVVCEFKDALGFPPETLFQDRPDMNDVRNALAVRPRIFANIDHNALEHLRLAAGMAFLGWGSKWLPEDFESGLAMGDGSAVNMIISSVQNGRNLAALRHCGCKTVKFLGASAGDSCPACKSIQERIWAVREAPELPHAQCTSEMGCRCACVSADF